MISGCLRASDSGSAAPKMELGSRSGGVQSRGKGFSHCLRSWQNFGPLEQQELNTKLRETPCPDLVGGLREKKIEEKTLHFCCSQICPLQGVTWSSRSQEFQPGQRLSSFLGFHKKF